MEYNMLWSTLLHDKLLHSSSPPPFGWMCCPQLRSFIAKPWKFHLLLSPRFEYFPVFVEFHEVFDPIDYEQTQAPHYFFPIFASGLQTREDQFSAQCIFAHIILCHANAPTPRKANRIFFPYDRFTSFVLLVNACTSSTSCTPMESSCCEDYSTPIPFHK